MDWSNVAKTAGNLGLKILGGTLLGPAGAAMGGQVAKALGLSADASADQVQQALATASPDSLVKLKQIEADITAANLEAGVKHHEIDAGTIDSVNETMQEETRQGHPWSGAWRPFWGFCSAVAFFIAVAGILFLIGYAIYKKDSVLLTTAPALITALAALFSVPGAILGVASWHRGQMQRIEAGEVKQPLFGGLLGKG
jgi:Holin of 3TMs, for gene-transfer release